MNKSIIRLLVEIMGKQSNLPGQPERPIPDSYWVITDKLLAGEYLGAPDEDEALKKLCRFLEAGVTFFLDLTEEGELEPYAGLLSEEAQVRGLHVEHRRMPIRNMDIPTPEELSHILDTIDTALEAGHVVYVHCWGGLGRTGTVVGCYLVEHGKSGKEALQEIARLRRGTPDGWKPSPQTDAQLHMVLSWKPHSLKDDPIANG